MRRNQEKVEKFAQDHALKFQPPEIQSDTDPTLDYQVVNLIKPITQIGVAEEITKFCIDEISPRPFTELPHDFVTIIFFLYSNIIILHKTFKLPSYTNF